MKKDVSKKRVKHPYGRQAEHTDWKRMILAFVLVVVMGVAVVMGYKHGKDSQGWQLVSGCYSRLTTWIAERRAHLMKGSLAKVKQLAAANKAETEPQVHFEFYTALPAMQVQASPPPTSDIAPVLKSFKPASAVVNAYELEQDLSAQMKDPIVSKTKQPWHHGKYKKKA